MMIHTSLASRSVFYSAALAAGVTLHRLDESGSRTHARKFDVILSGSANHGGAFGGDYRAATWDKWGIFLAAIFAADPDARAAGYYECLEHFRWATGHRFDTLTPDQQHPRHRWIVGVPYQNTCACGAIRRWEPRAVPSRAPTTAREWLVQITGATLAGTDDGIRDGATLAEWRQFSVDDDTADDLDGDFDRSEDVGSRYESHGAYARRYAADAVLDGLVTSIDELLAEADA